MDLLLDSHALLWTLYTPAVLPGSVAALLRNPANQLYVSEGSVWELSDKDAEIAMYDVTVVWK